MNALPFALTLLDLDGKRLEESAGRLRHCLRRHDLHAEIICVSCGLEIARHGYSGGGTPALLAGGVCFCHGRELSDDVFETLCRRLAARFAS